MKIKILYILETLLYSIDKKKYMNAASQDSIPSIKSERDVAEIFFNNRISAPFRIICEVTYRCNAHCIHCYAPPPHPAITELTPEQWETAIHHMAENGVFRIVFTGGEPLLREDLCSMIELSHELGMLTFLETNGSLVDEEHAAKLVDAGLQYINMSINRWRAPLYDAFSGHKGLFNKVIKAFTILKEYPIEPAVFTTINKMNIQEIPKIIDLAAHLNAGRIAFVHISPAGRAVDSEGLYPSAREYVSVLKEIEKKESEYPDLVIKYPNLPAYYFEKSIGLEAYHRIQREEGYIEQCTAGITSFVIDPAGNIKPCTVTSHHILGSIISDSLTSVWRTSSLLEKLRDYKKETESPCDQCHLVSHCVAGHRCLDYQLECLMCEKGSIAAPLCKQCFDFMQGSP